MLTYWSSFSGAVGPAGAMLGAYTPQMAALSSPNIMPAERNSQPLNSMAGMLSLI